MGDKNPKKQKKQKRAEPKVNLAAQGSEPAAEPVLVKKARKGERGR